MLSGSIYADILLDTFCRHICSMNFVIPYYILYCTGRIIHYSLVLLKDDLTVHFCHRYSVNDFT